MKDDLAGPGPHIVPANRVGCHELAAVFGERGGAARCQCQRYRLARGESFSATSLEERRERFREQTACADPQSPGTSGLVALVGGQAVGWCAVAPRRSYEGLVRNSNQTAWRGRSEDRQDPGVWAVTCIYTSVGHRGQGIARALAQAAVQFAHEQGATRLEAYPITSSEATWGEEHPGPLSVYVAAGMSVVHRPSPRRAVVAIDFDAALEPRPGGAERA